MVLAFMAVMTLTAIELMVVIIMTLKLGKMLVNRMQNGVSINF